MSNLNRKIKTKIIYEYHEVTKHGFGKFSRSKSMDWNCQPNVFRTFNSEEKELIIPSKQENIVPYLSLYHSYEKPFEINEKTISQFLYFSFSLSAVKSYKDISYSLRVNPSSGALYPLECYILTNESKNSILYHYNPLNHNLEIRSKYSSNIIQKEGFIIGISSIHWRESWKYGERAFRYSQLDTGHAIACARQSAKILNWKCNILNKWEDKKIANFLGLNRKQDFPKTDVDRVELEHPEVLLWIGKEDYDFEISEEPLEWFGKANQLSIYHDDWEIIQQVSEECSNFIKIEDEKKIEKKEIKLKDEISFSAQEIIRKRRSAQEFDGISRMSKHSFYSIISKLIPEFYPELWKNFSNPKVNIGLFIHRVKDVPSGLYVLIRNENDIEEIKKQWKHQSLEFEWKRVQDCESPLYLLIEDNAEEVAKGVSCDQEIASDSCFSVSMITNFVDSIETYGSHMYKKLFWECGYIGQILYLEAEAHEFRGTGIGCFYDNPTHLLFGLTKNYQTLYHFTIGKALEDKRIKTTEPYSDK